MRKLRVIGFALFLLTASPFLFAQNTNTELLFTQGVDRYNNRDYDHAALFFEKVLAQDPRYFLAMEYLAFTFEKKNNIAAAVQWLMNAKPVAPVARTSLIDFHLARLFLIQKDVSKAKQFLEEATHEGEFIAEAPYLLAYLHYVDGNYLEALRYFEKAGAAISPRSPLESDRQLMQAIHTYKGEIFARYGYDRFAISEFWKAERGDSVVLRTSAWSMHADVNVPSWSASIGESVVHDSNAAILSLADQTVLVQGESPSIGHVFSANGGYKTAPGKPWVLGADADLKFQQYFRSNLEGVGGLQVKLKPFVDFWTRRGWVLRGSYDFQHQQFNTQGLTALQTMQGPGLELQYFPYRRWVYSIGGRYLWNQFYVDSGRNSDVFEAFAGLKFSSPLPKFKPQLLYRFQMHSAPSVDARAFMHYGVLRLDYQPVRRVILAFDSGLIKRAFPNHTTGRSDTGTMLGVSVRFFMGEHWMLRFGVERYRNGSTLVPQRYVHILGTAGLSYTF